MLTTTPAEKSYRYIALGDSYTIGESLPPESRWPVQLAAALREAGIQVAEPEIIARTGWITSELLAAMDKEKPLGPYELVTLLIGVNNQYRGLPVEDYRQDLKILLNRAVELAGGNPRQVLVVTIPDWGIMPYAQGRDCQKIGREIDWFNAVLKEQAQLAEVTVVDVTPISRLADVRPEFIAMDGLHPSAVQYGEWVKIIFPEVLKVFE